MAAGSGADQAATSVFFSITGLVFDLAGAFASRLADRLGPAVMTAIGAVVMGGGLVLTGLAGAVWVGYLTYGIGIGVGAACAYTPTPAVPDRWFARRRSAVFGLAAAGTGCGMLALPSLAAAVVRRPPLPTAGEPDLPLGRVVRSPEFQALYASWC